MLLLVSLILLCIVLLLPQLWVKHVMRKYATHINLLPGTGGQLAEHLIERFALDKVKLEEIDEENDHYNPNNKTIYLSKHNYREKSLTAVAIATHEFSHALQHHIAYKPLIWRNRLIPIITILEKTAALLLISFPFVTILLKAPILSVIGLVCGLIIMILPIIFHLLTLPVELDASFNRALPLLDEGEYLPPSAIPKVRKILSAAAWTYVAASLASLINFYRWFAIIKR